MATTHDPPAPFSLSLSKYTILTPFLSLSTKVSNSGNRVNAIFRFFFSPEPRQSPHDNLDSAPSQYNFPPFYFWVLILLSEEVGSCDMVLDNVLSSPHRRSPSYRRPFPPNELGSWSTLIRRHRFLLTALALLTFLCTIYLYFAVTLSPSSSCFGLNGAQKAQCQLELAKTSMAKGKLKIL